MSKKVKVLVSVLVAAVLLTVGGTATVMAQDEPTRTPEATTKGRLATGVGPQIEFSKSFGFVGDNMTAGLLTRVADNLGVTEEELANAYKLAWQEMKKEAFIRYLDKALENELITEDEYNAIKAWWEVRPEATDALSPRALDSQGLHRRHIRSGHGELCTDNMTNLLPPAFGSSALRGRYMWEGSKGWSGTRLPRLVD